jgi:hypothetical protein
MPLVPHGREVAITRIEWPQCWRVIATRFPPIHLFERVSTDPAVWEVLIELEALTNPRVRNDVGNINLVPPAKRVSGRNASWVMAPFTHVNKNGSRFSDGTYGVYYAAGEMLTAIAETAYHFGRIAMDSDDPPRREDMRVLVGSIQNDFEDVESLPEHYRSAVLAKDSYKDSRAFALTRKCEECNGLSYPSVRRNEGHCIASFWPDAVGIPIQERHLRYEWDGARVGRYFDFKKERWLPLGD